ncbi:MAG: biotin/lipoyl-containing protein [Burkholderiales bacterium]
MRSGWRLNDDNHHDFLYLDGGRRVKVVAHYRQGKYLLELPGGMRTASAELAGDNGLNAELDGARIHATVIRRTSGLTIFTQSGSHVLDFEIAHAAVDETSADHMVSPLPGAVIQVLVKAGEVVAKGQALMIIEAMKMEHTIAAPRAGTVSQIYFRTGEQVGEGAQLLDFKETATA